MMGPISGEQLANTPTPNVPAAQPTPAAAPPTVAAPAQDQAMPPFMGAVLSTIAGGDNKVTGYDTDENGKQSPRVEKKTTGDKLRDIARSALIGLAAGSRVDPRNGGALAGLGAGAEAVMQKNQQQDLLQREESDKDFERNQKVLMQKHEIARGNALTYATYQAAMQQELDHDPERQANISLAKAASESGIPVRYMDWDDAQKELATSDMMTTHAVRPIGYRTQTDSNGNPILNADGSPKRVGQVAVIDGLHDGKITLPQSFVDDAKKFGVYGGATGAEGLTAGHEIPVGQLMTLDAAIQEGKKKTVEGWTNAKIGWTGKDNNIPVQINAMTGESRPFKGGVVPEEALAAKGKEKLTDAQAAEARASATEKYAGAQEKTAEAAVAMQLAGAGGKDALPGLQKSLSQLSPEGQTVLRNLPPAQQSALLQYAAGKLPGTTYSSFPRKGTGQISKSQADGLAAIINPNFSAHLYDDVQKAHNEISSQKGRDGLISFGQFLRHASDAVDVSNNFMRTGSPLVNKPMNYLKKNAAGNPDVGRLQTAITAAKDEWGTFIKNGHAMTADEASNLRTLIDENSTPTMVLGALNIMGRQAVDRLDEINSSYKRITGEDVPGIVDEATKQAAGKLGVGEGLARYDSNSSFNSVAQSSGPQSGPQTYPPGAVLARDANKNVVGYMLNGQYVPLQGGK